MKSALTSLGAPGLAAAFADSVATDAKKKRRKEKGKNGDANNLQLCKIQVGP